MWADLLQGVDLGLTPGCAIGLLAEDGEPAFFFQGSCERSGPAIAAETIWEAASLTKPLIALLALERVSSDATLLRRPLTVTAEEFGAVPDDRWRDLTLWHTLTHTTGLPNWRSAGEPLVFETDPGSIGYSGEGFELLLAELVCVSGQRPEVLTREFLHRLAMADSSFEPNTHTQRSDAIGHTETGQPVASVPSQSVRASGSLRTTVVDYLRFLAIVGRPAMVADEGVCAAARRMERAEVQSAAGQARTLGWALAPSERGDVLWQHGDNPGFKHLAAVRPSTGEAMVVLTNGEAGHELCRSAYRRVLDI